MWIYRQYTQTRALLALIAGPHVALEPDSEAIVGRTNVDDSAVPDRLVLCDPWWLKCLLLFFFFVRSLSNFIGWLVWICLQFSPVL